MSTLTTTSTVPKTLVYIAGSGHSGSTLLDLILGGHDRIAALGEIHRLYVSANKDTPAHRCVCGEPVRGCSFWSRVDEEIRQMLGVEQPEILSTLVTTDPAYLQSKRETEIWPYEFRHSSAFNLNLNRLAMVAGSRTLWRLLAAASSNVRLHRTAILNSLLIFEAVRRAWDKPIIVDSTKNPARQKGLFLEARERFVVLRVIRDGRAVCYSRMRRENLPMEKCARIWKAENTKQKVAQLTMPKRLIFSVRYEELCRNPEAEVARILAILGLPNDPYLLDFRAGGRHSVGGNPMRFRNSEREIRLDEKWKTGLSREDLQEFEAIAGRLNRRLGYE